MAKRGTIDHPKTVLLASELDVDQAYAFGIMCALWDWAGEYASDGAIGRFSDRMIAVQGCKVTSIKPAVLVAALVKVRLLDEVEGEVDGVPARLYIHDWHDHCENWIREKLQREHRAFFSGEPAERPRGRPRKHPKNENREEKPPPENQSENGLKNEFPPDLTDGNADEKTDPKTDSLARAPVAKPNHAKPDLTKPGVTSGCEYPGATGESGASAIGPPGDSPSALNPEPDVGRLEVELAKAAGGLAIDVGDEDFEAKRELIRRQAEASRGRA